MTPEKEREGLKEAFSQACKMYRHFVNMRYYNFALFGVVTAGMATLHFQQLPANAQWARIWIRGSGVVVAVACGLFDWRLTDVLYYYQELMESLAGLLNVSEFKNPPRTSEWMWPLRVASLFIFGVVVGAWVFFAW